MSAGTTASFSVDNDGSEVVDSCCLLGTTINIKEPAVKKYATVALNRKTMTASEQLFNYCDISILTKIKNIRHWISL